MIQKEVVTFYIKINRVKFLDKFESNKIKMDQTWLNYNLQGYENDENQSFGLGTIHKRRLPRGVGRWGPQKEM